MAQRFFNQKVSKKMNTGTIVVAVIVVALLVLAIIILISVNGRKKRSNAVIEMRDMVAVEVNTQLPDKTLFFSELQNVKEDDIKVNYDDVNLNKTGKYKVSIKVDGKSYQSTLEVVDTEAPELVIKDISIPVGSSYDAHSFVSSCSDNSNSDCTIEFYDMGINQDGDKVDYSSYKDAGTYKVKIVAKDESGNATSPMTATLVIGSNIEKPTTCNYGSSEYDTSKILAVNITENGCAIDLNLYQNENKVAPVKALIESEEAKLKKEFNKINLNTENIYLNSNITPVLNTSGTGIVGYTLKMEVSIPTASGEKEVIESYFVNINGGREYIINKYL